MQHLLQTSSTKHAAMPDPHPPLPQGQLDAAEKAGQEFTSHRAAMEAQVEEAKRNLEK